jgi:cardiolipin synthase
VRVYLYPGMTHVKAMLADGWVCFGSANFNTLSLRLNQEADLATSDAGFAARFKQELFETDFEKSYELKEPVSVGWSDHLADSILNLF